MELIDHIIYINLDSRTDRLQHIKTVVSNFPPEKITRLSAVLNRKFPWIGCYWSHINAIKLAISNNWKNVLILEDDACWNKSIEWSILKTKIEEGYDAIVLGGMYANYDTITLKLNTCFGTSSYLVSNHYFLTLLSNFEEGLKKCVEFDSKLLSILKRKTEKFRLDNYWHQLMGKDNWFIVKMMHTIPSYSDISIADVDYRHRF
jgi:hypothetical protein